MTAGRGPSVPGALNVQQWRANRDLAILRRRQQSDRAAWWQRKAKESEK